MKSIFNGVKALTIAILFLISITLIYFFFNKKNNRKSVSLVGLTKEIDPDIVLINIGNGNREEISNLINNVNNCGPALIAIDVVFENYREKVFDSTLMESLKKVRQDVIAFRLDSANDGHYSFRELRSYAMAEGYTNYQLRNGVASVFFPFQKIKEDTISSFAFVIAKIFNPKLQIKFTKDPVKINYRRTLYEYLRFDNADLASEKVRNQLKGKIALVGYFGPENEDMHYTPMRFLIDNPPSGPDTYGIVIVANEIRTLLENSSNK